jgi:hypothetical protein
MALLPSMIVLPPPKGLSRHPEEARSARLEG